MSDTANWAYQHTATVWRCTSRSDWSGVRTWAAPEAFACDYVRGIKTVRAGDRELISSLTLYTERDSISIGDMVLIGASASADPIAAGAVEVLSVGGTPAIDGTLPDFEVQAG